MEKTFQKISKLNFTLLLSLFVVFASCGNKNNESDSDEYSEDYIEDEYYEEETIIEDYVEIAYQEKNGVKL